MLKERERLVSLHTKIIQHDPIERSYKSNLTNILPPTIALSNKSLQMRICVENEPILTFVTLMLLYTVKDISQNMNIRYWWIIQVFQNEWQANVTSRHTWTVPGIYILSIWSEQEDVCIYKNLSAFFIDSFQFFRFLADNYFPAPYLTSLILNLKFKV